MSLRQAVVSSLAVAQVNALQLVNRAGVHVHPLEVEPMDTSKFVGWNMCGDNRATSNNLGGLGPGKGTEEMRVPAVKTVKIAGQKLDLDLVVTIAKGSEYKANEPKEINKVDNCLGFTNVLTGSTAKLDFKFTLPGESSAWVPPENYVPKFKFTIMDMDGNKMCDDDAKKPQDCVQEVVTFDTPVDHLYLDDEHEFEPTGEGTEDSPLVVSSLDIVGNGRDNPRLNADGLLELNRSQAYRTVSVGYKGITAWSISFKADGRVKRKPTGRNFMWTGASNVADPMACKEWNFPTFEWDLCKKELSSNNLGGQGPDGANDENAAKEIRYSNVATVHEKSLDLLVTAEDDYTPYNVSRNTIITDRSYAGIHGCFGAINVKAATKAHLTFAFIDHETGEIAKLAKSDGFGFSVFDIDQSDDPHNEERVHFSTPYAHEAYEGAHVQKVKDAERTYRSTAFGKGSDNILEEEEVNTTEQIARTVKVMYNGEMTGGAAQWKVTFDVRGGVKGRNFLFGGCMHHKEDVDHPQ